MQEPVLHDNRAEHLKFCEFARKLIEEVTGRSMTLGENFDIGRLHRASIVAETRITYNEKELLQMIHQHLLSKGFQKAANALQTEADLPSCPAGDLPPTPTSLRSLVKIKASVKSNRHIFFQNFANQPDVTRSRLLV